MIIELAIPDYFGLKVRYNLSEPAGRRKNYNLIIKRYLQDYKG